MHSHLQGYTYAVMLIAVAVSSITAAITGAVTSTAMQRERETELIFRGQQYQLGIQRYYEAGAQRQYPQSLDRLVKDPRFNSRRHIRRLYSDPMAKNDSDSRSHWQVIRNDSGGIIGVASMVNSPPIKRARFPHQLKHFEGAVSYREWTFIYRPKPLISDQTLNK